MSAALTAAGLSLAACSSGSSSGAASTSAASSSAPAAAATSTSAASPTSAAASAAATSGGAGASSAGSSSAAPSSSAPTSAAVKANISGTIKGIYDTQYKAALDPIVADFEKQYPNVKVDITYQGGDLGTAIMTELQAGTAPDILLTFPGGQPADTSDNVIPLAHQGRILPFTADWSSQVPALWQPSVEYQGKLYAFPGAVQPLSAMYNQSLLTKLGLSVPTTLDEVYKLCADAKSKGVYAYAQGLGDTSAGPQMLSFGQMAPLLYAQTPTWDAGLATGKVSYTSSPWVTQFQVYEQMFKDGCFGNGALGRTRVQGQNAVAKRQALGLVDVGAVLAGIKASDPNDTFVVSAIPASNSGSNAITALPGYVLTVNAKSKNPAAAQAFLAFAGEPAESGKYAKGFGSVPLVPNTQYQVPAELKDFADAVNAGKVASLASLQPEVQTTLNTAVQSMLLGKLTPQGVAQKMQSSYSKTG
ncbi:extracellular solute-binding protein [Acidothermaceae bacterium B102]|nr:extracellular solute-binding protein [Acidothermaceae bacterium B102]